MRLPTLILSCQRHIESFDRQHVRGDGHSDSKLPRQVDLTMGFVPADVDRGRVLDIDYRSILVDSSLKRNLFHFLFGKKLVQPRNHHQSSE
jgi:hypothetical protein